MATTDPKSSRNRTTANWKAGDYIRFTLKSAFLSIAILYLFTYATFTAVRAVYEAY